MKTQKGSSLIVALVMLTIITVVAVYSLEGSNIQSKMVSNSLFSTLTYQECRNEQEAQIRKYNTNNGADTKELLDLQLLASVTDPNTGLEIGKAFSEASTITEQSAINPPKSNIDITWRYQGVAPASRSGFDLSVDSPSKALVFENDCLAQYRFSDNSQTLGAVVETLTISGKTN